MTCAGSPGTMRTMTKTSVSTANKVTNAKPMRRMRKAVMNAAPSLHPKALHRSRHPPHASPGGGGEAARPVRGAALEGRAHAAFEPLLFLGIELLKEGA